MDAWSDACDEHHVTMISDGLGTYTVRRFSGPLVEPEGCGNQQETLISVRLSLEDAEETFEKWQNDPDDEEDDDGDSD